MRRSLLLILPLLAALQGAAGDKPSPIVAVLSSQSGPYLEAFSAFKRELGREVPVVLLEKSGKPNLPAGVRTVVAFGGKAALASYPTDVDLVYCLSPAATVSAKARRAATVGILLTPDPKVLAEQFKVLQPKMQRIGILWHSPSYDEEIEALRAAFSAAGVEVVLQRLQDKDHLPESLRRFMGRVDALWIPPDPVLINEQNLVSLREYSWGNHIPFYAPTAGLVEMGAVASVSVNFTEIGRAAARAAAAPVGGLIHVDKLEIVLNPKAAAACGLRFTNDAVTRATRVLQP